MTRSTQAGLLTLRSSVTVTLLIILQRGQQIASSSCRLFAFSQEIVKLLYSNSFLLQLSHLFACMECLRKITLACTCMTCAKAEGRPYLPEVAVCHGGSWQTVAPLSDRVILVDTQIQLPDSIISVGCDGDKIVSSLCVKFGSRFSSFSSGICGHCTATGGD